MSDIRDKISHTRERLLLLLAGLVVLFSGIGAYNSWNTYRRTSAEARATRELVERTVALLSSITDAETGQRGFLLTGEDRYLKPYRQSLAGISFDLDTLSSVAAARRQAGQLRRIERLRPLVKNKLDELAQTIDLRRRQGADAALAIVRTDRGQALMEQIRAICAEIRVAAYGYFNQEAAKAQASANETGLIAILGSASIFVLLVVATASIEKGTRRRLELIEAVRLSADQMRQTRDWFQTTLSSIGDGVIATDAAGRITLLNAVAQALTGWTNEEAVGKPLEQVFAIRNAETGLETENPVARVLREGRIVGLANHTRLIAKDGRQIPIDDSAAPIRDGGHIAGVVLVFRDVTERIRTQEQLRQELAGARGLYELTSRLMALEDLPSLLSEILSAALAITGADKGNIQILDSKGVLRIQAHHGFSKDFLDFFNGVDGDDAATCARALANHQRVVVEDVERNPIFVGTLALRVLLADGVRAVQSTPLVNRAGALVGVLSTHYGTPHQFTGRDLRLIVLLAQQAADLIERSRMHDLVRLSEERFRLALKGSPVVVMEHDRELRFTFVHNPQPPVTDPALFLGKRDDEVLPPAAVSELMAMKTRVLASGVGERGEVRVFHAGQTYYYDFTTEPLRESSGAIIGLRAAAFNLTEQKKTEEALRFSNAALVRANEDLNQFAFAASHDLQEPLRMIKTCSQLLLEGNRGQLDSTAANSLKFITEGTERMRALLADLLDYTQLTRGEREPAAPVELDDIFQIALENCKAAVDEAGATVTHDPLPTVLGYKPHFVQLFQNLISNALKYRTEQSPRVHASAQRQNGFWRIAVRDNGIGIAPEYQQQIFGVFKRLHGRNIPGTGIGLAICKRVVERCGGQIWVESQPGHGSTFYFTVLPAERMVEVRG